MSGDPYALLKSEVEKATTVIKDFAEAIKLEQYDMGAWNATQVTCGNYPLSTLIAAIIEQLDYQRKLINALAGK